MRLNRLGSFWHALACFVVVLSASSAKAQCGTSNIGMVSGNPFRAEIVVTKVSRPTDSTKLTHSFRSNTPQTIARDNQGRVLVEFTNRISELDQGTEALSREQNIIMICDPVSRTMVQIDRVRSTATVTHWPPISLPRSSFCSTRLFNFPIGPLAGKDLGYQTIEGVEARGERRGRQNRQAANEGSPSIGSTTETWCSDELSAIVLTATEDMKTGDKLNIAMQNLQRTDPDPALFQIPSNYAVTELTAEVGERGKLKALAPSNQQP
jgi:hypothetical protein